MLFINFQWITELLREYDTNIDRNEQWINGFYEKMQNPDEFGDLLNCRVKSGGKLYSVIFTTWLEDSGDLPYGDNGDNVFTMGLGFDIPDMHATCDAVFKFALLSYKNVQVTCEKNTVSSSDEWVKQRFASQHFQFLLGQSIAKRLTQKLSSLTF